jgi:hypothetical protein
MEHVFWTRLSNEEETFMATRTPEQRTRDEVRVEQVLTGTIMPISDSWRHTKVVGVKFSNEDGSSRQAAIAEMSQFDFVDLVHNPNDKWDKNAVRVLAALADRSSEGQTRRIQIGHLDGALATELAPRLDAGEPWGAIVTRIADKITKGVCLMLFRRVVRKLPPRDAHGRFCRAATLTQP